MPNRRELADGGCTGLYLVIQPSGVKSWAARYRYRGRSTKLTLGPVLIGARAESASTPEVGAPLSLASARSCAPGCCAKLRLAAIQRQRSASAANSSTPPGPTRCRRFAKSTCGGTGRNLRSIEASAVADFELFYPALGRLPIEEIRRGQFIRVLDQIADERGQRRAGRALGSMKTLLNWHGNSAEYVSKS